MTTRAGASARARVGVIDFLNSAPIVHAIDAGFVKLPRSVEIVRGPPRSLNEKLLSGGLDVSFVSSIEFARHHDELLLLPGISINSRGFVDSVTLVHPGDLRAIDGGAIAATALSATSDVLLRILLERHFRLRAGLVKTNVDLSQVGSAFAGALLIGDEALAAKRSHFELSRTDLGAAWQAFAGVPMVFAVFAARREYARAHPRQLATIHRAFLASRDFGMAHLDDVAARADHDLSVRARRAYFANLDFRLEGDILEGLRTFYEYAYKIGVLDSVPTEAELRGER